MLNGDECATLDATGDALGVTTKGVVGVTAVFDFGNPATSWRSVALRPRLAAGLPLSVVTKENPGKPPVLPL